MAPFDSVQVSSNYRHCHRGQMACISLHWECNVPCFPQSDIQLSDTAAGSLPFPRAMSITLSGLLSPILQEDSWPSSSLWLSPSHYSVLFPRPILAAPQTVPMVLTALCTI